MSNCLVKGKYSRIIDDQPLTPRRLYKKQVENEGYLTEKMAVLHSKITKL